MRHVKTLIVLMVLVAQFGFFHLSAQASSCLMAVDAPGCAFGLPADQYNALLPIMNANPSPPAAQLPPAADDIDRYSVKAKDGHVLAAASSFSGIVLNGPLPFPMAWVENSTRPSKLPGAAPEKDAPIIPRYSRVYLFATVKAAGYAWYLVGPGQWLERRKVALVVPAKRPDGVSGRWVSVDTFEQVLIAYDNDLPVFTTLIASGVYNHQTRKGLYHVWGRFDTDDMSGAMGQPDQYSLPYVPYVMYFDGNISLHGAYWHDGFGFPHSHGCVNMSLTDARWMYQWSQNTPGMSVYVWRSR